VADRGVFVFVAATLAYALQMAGQYEVQLVMVTVRGVVHTDFVIGDLANSNGWLWKLKGFLRSGDSGAFLAVGLRGLGNCAEMGESVADPKFSAKGDKALWFKLSGMLIPSRPRPCGRESSNVGEGEPVGREIEGMGI